MSPPRPPSPPLGPPRGTYFSRRKARHPLPPSPAFTRILTSSINMLVGSGRQGTGPQSRRAQYQKLETRNRLNNRFYADELAGPAAVAKHDDPRDFGEQRIVLAQSDVLAGLKRCPTLAHQDGAAGYQFPAESFDAQALRVGIAPFLITSQTFFVCHIDLCQNLRTYARISGPMPGSRSPSPACNSAGD